MPHTKPIFFASQAELRKWYQKNHGKETELHVGYYKAHTGKQGVSRPESVDEALCFGWIDGILHSLGDESYTMRFTPRKKSSVWSAVNIKRIGELMEEGLVDAKGKEAFERRTASKMNTYASEQENLQLGKAYETLFKKNKEAWAYFKSTTASYKKAATWWVVSAKQEATRLKRLNTLIEDSAAGLKIKQLRNTGKK